jgi:hypothetical protein
LVFALVACGDARELLGRLDNGTLGAAIGQIRERLDKVEQIIDKLPRA